MEVFKVSITGATSASQFAGGSFYIGDSDEQEAPGIATDALVTQETNTTRQGVLA